MINKVVSLLLICAVLGTFSTALQAQTTQTKQEKKAAEVETKIKKLGTGNKAIVKVKLYSDTKYEGYVSQANDDDFVVVDKSGGSNTIKYSDVKSIGGKNMSTGAKIAIGVGIGAGVTLLVLFLIFQELAANS